MSNLMVMMRTKLLAHLYFWLTNGGRFILARCLTRVTRSGGIILPHCSVCGTQGKSVSLKAEHCPQSKGCPVECPWMEGPEYGEIPIPLSASPACSPRLCKHSVAKPGKMPTTWQVQSHLTLNGSWHVEEVITAHLILTLFCELTSLRCVHVLPFIKWELLSQSSLMNFLGVRKTLLVAKYMIWIKHLLNLPYAQLLEERLGDRH